MPKDWQERLDDTLAKIRAREGNDIYANVQANLARLTPDQRKAISRKISLGFRFDRYPRRRNADKTERRRGRRADKLLENLEARTFEVAFKKAAKRLRMEPIELDIRLHEPAAWYAGYPQQNSSLSAAYADGKRTHWDDSCGSVSSMVKDIIANQGNPGVWTRPVDSTAAAIGRAAVCAQVLQQLRGGNKYFRIMLGCHSFIVENIGRAYRVYQGYFAAGGDCLTSSMNDGQALPANVFLGHISNIIMQNANWPNSETALFRGSCDVTRGAENRLSDSVIWVETTATPRTVEQMTAEICRVHNTRNEEWNRCKRSAQTVRAYIAAAFV